MTRLGRGMVALALSASVGVAASSAFGGGLAAFPGAQGFGGDATGGRGGSVYVVTNLNDSGAGSFRDAVSHNNRIIVFAVSGYINLLSAVSAKSNLTILGQTAPGGGIAISGAEVSFFGQSNDIIQYMRFRDGTTDPGYKGTSSTSSSSSNALSLGNTTNMIVDHVSAEFAPYNNVDASAGTSNLTFSNSIFADPIASQRFNVHNEGTNTTYIGNIFANSHGRNALAKANSQYVNNVAYNYGYAFTTGNSAGNFSFDVINNYFVAGPSTTSPSDAFYQVDNNQSAYAVGNILDGNKDGVLNGSADNTVGSAIVLSAPWSTSTALLPTLSAAGAWAHDVTNAGDSLTHDPTTYATSLGYDQVDSQVISNITSNGTAGQLWSSQTQTGLGNGGFGVINSGALPTSTANDGIPDAWAVAHGISSTSASAALKLNALGYSMIEQYAYEISDVNTAQVWASTAGAWVTGSWSNGTPGIYDDVLIRGNGTVNGGVSIGGTDAANAFRISVGGSGPAAGETLAVSGGNLTVQDTIYLGDQNNATFNLSGGTVRAANLQLGNAFFFAAGNPTTYAGTFNFSGGVLQVGQVVNGVGMPGNWTGGGIWNWSGGTLQANRWLNVNAEGMVSGAGATVNTTGPDGVPYAGMMSGVLSGTGPFTKIGAGVLTLSANNSYGGNTTISAGAVKAANNHAFSGGTIFDNASAGIQLANGITIGNMIVAAPGANEFADVPPAGAVGTISGAVSVTGSSNQYRVGVSGTNATVILTGANTASGIMLITRGNVVFAGSGSLVNSKQAVSIGRSSATATLGFTVQDNALVQGVGLNFGGLGGTLDDLTTTVNLLGNGTLSAGSGAINVNNNAIGGAVTFNMSGNSTLTGATFTATGANQGQTILNFNGGTIVATAGDGAAVFFPALGPTVTPLKANVLAGGITVNDGGFGITIAQPLVNGSGTDGGFPKMGGGSVTLAANETYNGPTRVNAGDLIVTGSILNDSSLNVFITPDASGGTTLVRDIGAAASYAGWGSAAANDLQTRADIRAGKNAVNNANGESVTMAWRPRQAGEIGGVGGTAIVSDVLMLSGMENSGTEAGQTDPFALQMTYTGSANGALQLGWLNGSGVWVNATAGDFGTGLAGDVFTNIHGTWDAFAAAHGITDANIGNFLGSWGVDTVSGQVWAVVNHNSTFAVESVSAVPEPCGLGILAVAGPMLLARRRRR